MKIISYVFILGMFFLGSITKAQTVAMDFNRNDCAGNPHHLYSELDSGYVIIKEFIMTCNTCVEAGQAIEAMISELEVQYPGRVRLYLFAYTNSYTCAMMEDFKITNGFFNSATFDQGANMVAYYGGFGMPTVAIVGGTNHGVLYTSVGFTSSDTAYAGPILRNFLASSVGINEAPSEIQSIATFPNPVSDRLTVEMSLMTNVFLDLQLVDLNGKLVSEIFSDKVSAGTFTHNIDVSSFASGYYMLKATINNKSSFSKIRISH